MPPPLAFLPAVRAPEVAAPARWYLYQEDRLVLDHRTGDPLLPLARTADELGFAPLRTQYLGQMEGAAPLPCFSGELSATSSLPAGFHTHELRSLFEVFPEEEVVLAGRAPRVGHAVDDLQPVAAERRRLARVQQRVGAGVRGR